MITLKVLQEFLGCCSIINLALLILSALVIVFMRSKICKIHSQLFAIDESLLPKIYFQYLALYKIAIITLNIVPYLVLKFFI